MPCHIENWNFTQRQKGTHIYIYLFVYIYIYICVCVSLYVYEKIQNTLLFKTGTVIGLNSSSSHDGMFRSFQRQKNSAVKIWRNQPGQNLFQFKLNIDNRVSVNRQTPSFQLVLR